MVEKDRTNKNIVFLHPDLGIGGAERLVIDAAVALQSLGHKVTIFTSHCDPKHCFDEARDGTLDVRVRGNTLIPPNFLGRFAILCAILRQLHLVLAIAVFSTELRDLQPTTFFIDQLSACVPLLRVVNPRARVLFYCHFPDKLLVQRGAGWAGRIKGAYRVPFDALESWSTGCADGIVVNSQFTRGIFGEAFPRLKNRRPGVVYPCVDTEAEEDGKVDGSKGEFRPLWEGKKVLLSINRFERKKGVELAIKAYAGLSVQERRHTRLVIAGGYDPRVNENVSYHNHLQQLAESLNLPHATAKNFVSALSVPTEISVLFLLSVPNSLKSTLLNTARLLVYTPRNEHFGIVPLEAMLAGVPVLAANEGGPTETVVDGKTGWLRDVSKTEEWTDVMRKVLFELRDEQVRRMDEEGKRRVRDEFSKRRMAQRLDWEFDALASVRRPPLLSWEVVLVVMLSLVVALGAVTLSVYRP